jgi:ferredoxin/DMSO/TMAO reductase YedYZ heme-binding membrane subunit
MIRSGSPRRLACRGRGRASIRRRNGATELALADAVETARVVHNIAHTVGFASYFLLFLTVAWGITLRAGWALTRFKHATIYGTHMTLALLGLTLGIVHAIVQLFNPLGTIGVIQEFVPFVDPRDPIGVGFGVIATELMLSLAISVLIQRKMGYTKWRSLHSFAYAAYTLLTAHLLISGSHVLSVPYIWPAVVASQIIVIALWLITSSQIKGVPRAVGERAGARLRAQQATVNVDPGRCVRFGFCEHEAPEVFQLRSDGRLAYQPQVPSEQIDAVIQAARVCPARAIMLTRQATTVVMSNQETKPAAVPDEDRSSRAEGRGDRPRAVRDDERPTTRVPRAEKAPRAIRGGERRTEERPRAVQDEDRPSSIRDDRPRVVRAEDRPRAVRGDFDRPRAVRSEDDRPRGLPGQRPTRLERRGGGGGSRHGGGA